MRATVNIGPEHLDQLKQFFSTLAVDEETKQKFHPHAFNDAAAEKIANYSGKDLYIATIESGKIIAYGMLRGWDERFDKPSLGMVVKPGLRGQGIGTEMLHYLIGLAKEKNAPALILKVYKTNPARHLYERSGFEMEEFDVDQLRGTLDLH